MNNVHRALDKALQLAEVVSDWHLEEVEIDGEMVNIYDLRAEFRDVLNAAHETPEIDSLNELLEAVKMAYRKHHLDDNSIGWDELSDTLHNAINNAMGADGYLK